MCLTINLHSHLLQAEESLKISGDRIEKLKEKIVCGGKMAQLNAQLKKENQASSTLIFFLQL